MFSFGTRGSSSCARRLLSTQRSDPFPQTVLVTSDSSCTSAVVATRLGGQTDHNPFNRTGQNEPGIESENEGGRRAYTSMLDPPCTEGPRIVAQSKRVVTSRTEAQESPTEHQRRRVFLSTFSRSVVTTLDTRGNLRG